MSAAIDFIQFDERMTGEASPDYDDTLNRALKTVVSESGADEDAFVGFALRPVVAPSVGQFYRATDTDVGASWQTLTAAMVSDLTSAATGITKVGTIDTGVWHGSSIATTYTDAKVKTVTGTANRLTVGGTATDPTFDISSAYVGQATITTLGTVTTGVWTGTSIGTTYTDAKVVSLSGVTDRTTIGGTAGVPIIDIAATYVGQGSITTVGTIASGTWQGTSIATTYTDAKIKTVTGTVGTITISGTATDPIFTISAAYIGQNTITTLGTVTTGVWNGTAVATAFTIAQVIDLTGTTNRITIGGTATHPTVDVSAAYVGQATITTLGTIATGVWNGTSITTSFTDAKVKTVTGTANRLTIGGTATDPTFDISAAYVGQATITTVGTVTTGTWAATAITVDKGGTNLTSFTAGDMIYASGATTLTKLAIGTAAQILVTNGAATAPAWHTLVTADITDLTTATTGITKVGTVTTGVWNAGVIPALYGGTGVNNGSNTITLGGTFTTSGAFATTLTVTGATNVTLPTTGTLVNSAVTSLASLTSVGGAFAISGAFTGATTGAFSSTLSTSQLTITDTASRIIAGATSLSLRNHANDADNFLISDAGAITVRSTIGGVTTISGTTATFTNFGGTLSTAAQPNVTSVGTLTSLSLSGQITTTGGTGGATAASVYMNASNPGLGWRASGGGTDEKFWDLLASATTMTFRTVNDAASSAVNWLQVTRSGTAITSIALNGPVSGITTLAGTGAMTGFTSLTLSATLAALAINSTLSDSAQFLLRNAAAQNIAYITNASTAGVAGGATTDSAWNAFGKIYLNPNNAATPALTINTNLSVTFGAGAAFTGAVSGITTLAVSSTSQFSGALSLLSAASIGFQNAANNTNATIQNTGGSGVNTMTLTATTIALSGAVTASGKVTLNASGVMLERTGATTGAVYMDFASTGGRTYMGSEVSTGGAIINGSSAYATILSSGAAVALELGTNTTVRLSISSAGAFDFKGGALSGIASLATTDPSGGSGVWLLGKYLAAVVTLDTAHYVEVKIDGTLRKLAVVT